MVTRLLKILLNVTKRFISKGLLIYVGINEYNEEINEIFEPTVSINTFYYNCNKEFIIDRFLDNFTSDIKGYIIFMNGDICNIYKFTYTFIKIKSFNGNLVNRQSKGGQSALRFSRIAEESRHEYVIRVITYLNSLRETDDFYDKFYIYGSNEIVNMLINRKELLVNVINEGFLDFNESTIKNPVFREVLKRTDIDYSELTEIIKYLDTDIDKLDFNVENCDNMKKYYYKKDLIKFSKHELYYRVEMFEYIGIKWFSYDEVC